MTPTRSTFAFTGLLALLAGASLANVSSAPPPTTMRTLDVPIEASEIPPECTQFLAIPSDTTSALYPWQQKLSLAACRQSFSVAPVSAPQQLGAMVATIEHAMAPSQVIYRDAIAHGPDEIRILANYGLGMTYTDTIVRARRALAGAGGFGGATYGRGSRDRAAALRLALEPLLAPDRDGALSAFAEVARLASADPSAADASAVTKLAVTNARAEAAMLR